MKDYKETVISKNVFVREFKQLPSREFPWHRDSEDRLIEILHAGLDWKFQKDNQLPFILMPGMEFTVKKKEFHRIISGSGILRIRLTKLCLG